MGVGIPVAMSAFPDELYQLPLGWAERAYPKLIHYNRLPKGGHFAAREQPDFLTREMRDGFRSLRAWHPGYLPARAPLPSARRLLALAPRGCRVARLRAKDKRRSGKIEPYRLKSLAL